MPLAEAFVRSGKVRDLYRLDDERLLLVASDRLSAFDVVLPTPIPDKGRVLTGLSRFWFARDGAPRAQPPAVGRPGGRAGQPHRRQPGGDGRAARPDDDRAARPRCCRSSASSAATCQAPAGRSTGASGRRVRHPAARRACASRDRLPEPVFTPGLEGAPGPARREHHRSTRVVELVGARHAEALRRAVDRACTSCGAAVCAQAGIILADTKFEFGVLPDGELILIDEVMTPDSSRFWDADDYQPGRAAGELRQAVRPRLARAPAVGRRPSPGRRCRPTSCTAPASATSRPTNESPGRASPAISRRT